MGELRRARMMADKKTYVATARDKPLTEVVDGALDSWRDLREAVSLRNRTSEDAWATYEAAQKAPTVSTAMSSYLHSNDCRADESSALPCLCFFLLRFIRSFVRSFDGMD